MRIHSLIPRRSVAARRSRTRASGPSGRASSTGSSTRPGAASGWRCRRAGSPELRAARGRGPRARRPTRSGPICRASRRRTSRSPSKRACSRSRASSSRRRRRRSRAFATSSARTAPSTARSSCPAEIDADEGDGELPAGRADGDAAEAARGEARSPHHPDHDGVTDVSALLGVVEDDPERGALPGAHHAHPMSHLRA